MSGPAADKWQVMASEGRKHKATHSFSFQILEPRTVFKLEMIEDVIRILEY